MLWVGVPHSIAFQKYADSRSVAHAPPDMEEAVCHLVSKPIVAHAEGVLAGMDLLGNRGLTAALAGRRNRLAPEVRYGLLVGRPRYRGLKSMGRHH